MIGYEGGDEMAGRRKWIVVLSVILVLLLIVAGLCYVKGWSFTGNKDGADERERWQEVLSKEVLEQYDSVTRSWLRNRKSISRRRLWCCPERQRLSPTRREEAGRWISRQKTGI